MTPSLKKAYSTLHSTIPWEQVWKLWTKQQLM